MRINQAKFRLGVVARVMAFAIWFLIPTLAAAQQQQPFNVKEHYTKSEHRVAMRDGLKLFTTVYAPKDQSKKVPIMLFRTPYGTGPHGLTQFKTSLGPSSLFARDGFIFVYQDVRGKGLSEGKFVVMKPVIPKREGPGDVDETTDTYDTIQWILDNVPHHNGRLGVLVEVNCETDFVARTPEFVQFCRDLAMHVAAMSPLYIRSEEAPPNARDKELIKTTCLLEQPFVKDQGMTVGQLLNALAAKTGENVVIRRFARFSVGD